MSDAKDKPADHSPAPWLLGNENNACAEVFAGPVRICFDRLSNEPNADDTYVISREEMLANVNLVIAAPALLKALRAVVRVADRKTDEFDLARKALALVDGDG